MGCVEVGWGGEVVGLDCADVAYAVAEDAGAKDALPRAADVLGVCRRGWVCCEGMFGPASTSAEVSGGLSCLGRVDCGWAREVGVGRRVYAFLGAEEKVAFPLIGAFLRTFL